MRIWTQGLTIALLATAMLAAGCGSDTSGSSDVSASDGTDGNDGSDGVDGMDGSDGSDGSALTYADAQEVYRDNCIPCHEAAEGDAPGSCEGGTCFVSFFEDADKDASGNYAPCAGVTVAECTIVRIHDGTMPQGGGQVPEADLQLLEDWVDQGFPE